MGLFSFLSGKSPEDIERAGDQFYNAGEFGLSKLEYEKALDKAERKAPENQNYIQSLKEKIGTAKEALAKAHLHTGGQLMESHNFAEAEDLFRLALELSNDPDFKQKIESALARLDAALPPGNPDVTIKVPHPVPAADVMDNEEEYFAVLCNALPEAVKQAYHSYGRTFRQGFIALNNGNFKTAAKKLSEAFEKNPSERPLVALELATALMNLGQYDRASELILQFVGNHPDELRGYQMLCDVYWATGNFDDAVRLIEGCPGPLKETFPVQVLLGETYFHMEKYAEAQAVFLSCQSRYGQNELVSRALAKIFEAMGDAEKAKNIYGQILAGCTQCGARTDPFVKRRYADLCFAAGERSSRILELYLSVAQEDPDSREDCYQRIGEIYEALGNLKEARRYQSLS
ncbi:MAG: tetratricopeptide repeat protein [Desulfosalsimonadaceae bacterium]